VVAVAFVLSSLVLFVSCSTPPARAEQAPAAAVVWRPLGSWSGDGSRQTESFEVSTGALRLQWETRASSPAGTGRFRVWLYSAISGRPLQLFVDHTGNGSGTAHAADDPRTSYLVIESEQVAWTASLDESVTR
jgi:hypothetical protein